MDLVGIPQTQANVTCYKHDYIGNIAYQNNQLEAYYTEEGRTTDKPHKNAVVPLNQQLFPPQKLFFLLLYTFTVTSYYFCV
jgi:hypothetical protein